MEGLAQIEVKAVLRITLDKTKTWLISSTLPKSKRNKKNKNWLTKQINVFLGIALANYSIKNFQTRYAWCGIDYDWAGYEHQNEILPERRKRVC